MASTSAFSSIKIADEATIKQQQLKLKKEILENAFRRSRTEERHIFAGTLEFMAVQDHILESLCRHSDTSESAENCQLCRYEKQLGLPLLPEMIFPQNQLTISCRGKSLINFNAFDALQMVDKNHLPNVQVGPSAVWQSARQQEMSPARQFKQPFDWTYTSNYQGTLGEGVRVELADVEIDYERLKRRDPIQFHSQIILYEDELADNGCAQMMIRVRVMPETFLLLCRFYLRVDHVMVRILDTRLYGTAENREFAVREWTKREAAYSELSKEALDCIIDPNALFAHVPLIETRTEKIFYPK